MFILLQILLFLQLVAGPGTYQESEIMFLQANNQSIISTIESDPVLLEEIDQQYAGQASEIIVVDDKENP